MSHGRRLFLCVLVPARRFARARAAGPGARFDARQPRARERQALEVIDAMGLRNVVVKDKHFDRENELTEIRRKSAGLSTRDAQAVRDAVPGVERVVAKIGVEAWKVLSSTGRAKPRVLGVSSDYPALVRIALHEGRFFDRTDEDTHAAVCVIGRAPLKALLDELVVSMAAGTRCRSRRWSSRRCSTACTAGPPTTRSRRRSWSRAAAPSASRHRDGGNRRDLAPGGRDREGVDPSPAAAVSHVGIGQENTLDRSALSAY